MRELISTPSALFLDLRARLERFMMTQGYDKGFRTDPAELEAREVARKVANMTEPAKPAAEKKKRKGHGRNPARASHDRSGETFSASVALHSRNRICILITRFGMPGKRAITGDDAHGAAASGENRRELPQCAG